MSYTFVLMKKSVDIMITPSYKYALDIAFTWCRLVESSNELYHIYSHIKQ